MNCVDFDSEYNNIKGENFISVYYKQSFNFPRSCDYPTKEDIQYIKFGNYRYNNDSNFIVP